MFWLVLNGISTCWRCITRRKCFRWRSLLLLLMLVGCGNPFFLC